MGLRITAKNTSLGLIVLSRGHAPQQMYQREKKTDVGMERLESAQCSCSTSLVLYGVIYGIRTTLWWGVVVQLLLVSVIVC